MDNDEVVQVSFCEYIDNEIKEGRSGNIPRFCPVPKVKGLYTPTQEQIYKQLVGVNCNISKKLPGTLTPGATSRTMQRSVLLRSNGTRKGRTQFVLNTQQARFDQGLPGGVVPPIRNQF